MFIIVGLGNPGKEYDKTRHNAGFMAIDALADKYGISVDKKQFKGLTGRGIIAGQQVLLVKPTTFMNLSGESVRQAFDFYKPEIDQVLILFDDISLPIGQLRVRKKGSAGGHNGIKSIIAHLGSQDFPRIKIGVGGPGQKDLVNHVLGHFNKEESKIMEEAVKETTDAVECFLMEGPDRAMNLYNKKKKTEEEQS